MKEDKLIKIFYENINLSQIFVMCHSKNLSIQYKFLINIMKNFFIKAESQKAFNIFNL